MSRGTKGRGVYLAVFAALAFSAWTTHESFERINEEGAIRRSQTCTSFETAHLEEVRKLDATYKYLAQLPMGEKKLSINKVIKADLPALEEDAKSDVDDHGIYVPPYCDEPNVGRPEPDPVVPPRPPGV